MPRNIIERLNGRLLFPFSALTSLNCIIEHIVTFIRAILTAGLMGIGVVWLSKMGVSLPFWKAFQCWYMETFEFC